MASRRNLTRVMVIDGIVVTSRWSLQGVDVGHAWNLSENRSDGHVQSWARIMKLNSRPPRHIILSRSCVFLAVLLARCAVMCVAAAVLECGLAISDAGLVRVSELGARTDKKFNGQANMHQSWFAGCHKSNLWWGDNPTQTTRPSRGQGRAKGKDDKTCLDIMAAVNGYDVPMNMHNPGLVFWNRAIEPSVTSIMPRRSVSHFENNDEAITRTSARHRQGRQDVLDD